MGSAPSKPIKSVESINEEVFNEKSEYSNLENLVDGLTIDSLDSSSNITTQNLNSWESELSEDPKNRLTQNALAKHEIADIVANSDSKWSLRDRYIFNIEVDTIGSPSFSNNQKSSGRCWIFAACNVLRAHVIKNYNLKPEEFQLSQSYLFFYDKLEKANTFLENIVDTADEPLNSRIVQGLMANSVGDGGQWDFIVNLVEKYGLVPYEVFPDNAQSTSTAPLNNFLTDKLREYALILRKLIAKDTPKHEVAAVKNSMTKEVYKIIALALGTPPKPNDSFKWEFIDKNGKFHVRNTSAIDFHKTHTRFDVTKSFNLINDPRLAYDTLFTVDRMINIYEGKPVEYLNLKIFLLKNAAIAMLKDNEPVFFACDVRRFDNRTTGVLDTRAFDYSLAFNTSLNLSKSDRMSTGSFLGPHAMTITGVHLDDVSGLPIRWKIENSWGDAVGDKGYFMMTDDWFDEFVFHIVTSKKYVDKYVYDLWKSKKYEVLPYYEGLGTFA